MLGRISEKIRRSKSYAHTLGFGKGGWVNVFIDFVISNLCCGFSTEDYFEIGNGYTLSKYAKRRYYSFKRSKEVQRKVNQPEFIHFLENKAEALSLFNDLVSRAWLYAPQSSFSDFMDFVNKTQVFIAKPVGGMCGKGIEKYSTIGASEEDLKSLYNHLVADDMLLEECIKAHDDIYLGTTALSTIRIFTMIDRGGAVHVLKAKYRVGTGDAITDATDGCCIHYPISIQYGIVEGPGISIDEVNGNYFYTHPGCDKIVVGMKMPMWDQVLEVVTNAAKKIPQIRYVGWDIAITNDSVEIIEGNHNPYHGTFEMMGTERLWWPKLKELI